MSAPVVISGVVSSLMFIGGAMGYIKKKSKASLISGSVIGAIYAFLAWQFSAAVGADATFYSNVATGFSVLISFTMGVRAVKTEGAAVPLGITVLTGAAAAGYFATKQ